MYPEIMQRPPPLQGFGSHLLTHKSEKRLCNHFCWCVFAINQLNDEAVLSCPLMYPTVWAPKTPF